MGYRLVQIQQCHVRITPGAGSNVVQNVVVEIWSAVLMPAMESTARRLDRTLRRVITHPREHSHVPPCREAVILHHLYRAVEHEKYRNKMSFDRPTSESLDKFPT
jgi:hypothetical protein